MLSIISSTGAAYGGDAKAAKAVVYKPPLRGLPAGRVGGGTRGATEREAFALLVLAPDHVGLTTREQPTLYWYISKPTSYQVELTIVEKHEVRPLVEKVLNGTERGGIQVIRLSEFGVRLKPDLPYRWSVALVTDAAHRSKDILAGGIIRRVDPPAGLAEKLAGAGGGAAGVYAEEGIWYDALAALSERIDASPGDAALRRERALLLKQVGLTEAAEAEATP